jgi:hypothetical protein
VCTLRHAEIAVRREAPSALAAALASSAAQPHPTDEGHVRLNSRASKGYVSSYAGSYAGLYARHPRIPSPVRARHHRRPEPLRGASRPQKPRPTGPLGGEVRAHLIHPSACRLCGSRLRRQLIHSADRLPHGALAISAHYGAPPSSMAIPFQPCRGQEQTERRRLQRTDRHTKLAPPVTIRP